MSAPCSLTKTIDGRCLNTPIHRVVVGCVHEHISNGQVCDEHLAAATDGTSNCHDCYYGDDPHTCPVLGRVMA